MVERPLPSSIPLGMRIALVICGSMSGLPWLTAGCTDSSTPVALTPYTGINIDSASLISGFGCGTAPGQVFRYVVRVDSAPDTGAPGAGLPAIGVFDCYTDGVFEALPLSDAGNYDFALTIYAWDQASLPPLLDCDGGPCSPPSPDALASVAPGAKWTTTCTATQQPGAVIFASCARLHLRPAEIGADASAPGADASADALD